MVKYLLLIFLPLTITASWEDPDSDYFFCRLNPLWSWSKARKECERATQGNQSSPIKELREFLEAANAGRKDLPNAEHMKFTIFKILETYEESQQHRNLLTADDIALLELVKEAGKVRNPDAPSHGFFESPYKGEHKHKGDKGNVHDEATTPTFGMNDRADSILKKDREFVVEAALWPKIITICSLIVGISYAIYQSYKQEIDEDLQEAEAYVESAYNTADTAAHNEVAQMPGQEQDVISDVHNVISTVQEKIDEIK